MRDLLVAGGGPAGLVTALHARRAGLSVLVVEPRAAPIDKACGEGLMPAAVAALRDFGVDVPGVPFTGIRYLGSGRCAVADFRGAVGLGVRRTRLHSALWRTASAAGVEFATGWVRDVEQGTDGVAAFGVRARYLVAADGLHSRLRAEVGVTGRPSRRPRWGVRAHFPVAPWTDRVEVYWAPDAEAYVTPVGADCVGVAVLSGARAPFADQLAAFPHLRARLPAQPVDRPRGAGPLRQRSTRRVAGRVLFVGDAAGYVDALTGEGLATAFACADALVARVVAGTPERYEHDYRMLTRHYRVLTSALLAAAQRPVLRPRIVPLAARAPRVFAAAVDLLAR